MTIVYHPAVKMDSYCSTLPGYSYTICKKFWLDKFGLKYISIKGAKHPEEPDSYYKFEVRDRNKYIEFLLVF